MKSYTLRIDEEHQKKIDEIKESFWMKTDSKAIKYAIDNYKLTQDVLEIKRKECNDLQKRVEELEETIKKAGNAMSFLKNLGAELD